MAKAVIFIVTVRLARLLQMKIANSYKRIGGYTLASRLETYLLEPHKLRGPRLQLIQAYMIIWP
jgi:hypothetical protein